MQQRSRRILRRIDVVDLENLVGIDLDTLNIVQGIRVMRAEAHRDNGPINLREYFRAIANGAPEKSDLISGVGKTWLQAVGQQHQQNIRAIQLLVYRGLIIRTLWNSYIAKYLDRCKCKQLKQFCMHTRCQIAIFPCVANKDRNLLRPPGARLARGR